MELWEQWAAMTPAQRERFLQGPALKPPPGVNPNLENPRNWTALCYGFILSWSIVSAISVILRLYSRLGLSRRYSLRIEDCE